MSFALGELGWTPKEYYNSSLLELHYASKGYFNKYKSLTELFRVSAFINYRSMGGKKTLNQVWPMAGETDKVKVTPEMIEKIKQIHGL